MKKKILAIGIIILLIGIIIPTSNGNNVELQTIENEESANSQYQVFGFLPHLGRGIIYSYWVFPGIKGYVRFDEFEGRVGICTIKGYSTELPTYFSVFLPEFIVIKILTALNLI
jgi:hypothetical protein